MSLLWGGKTILVGVHSLKVVMRCYMSPEMRSRQPPRRSKARPLGLYRASMLPLSPRAIRREKENQQPKKNQHLRENPNNRDKKRVVRNKFHPILRSTELFLVDPPTLSLLLEINQELKNNSQEEENKYKVQRARHRSKLRQLL